MTTQERNSFWLSMERAVDQAIAEDTDEAWRKVADLYASSLGGEVEEFSVRRGIGGGTPRLDIRLKPSPSVINVRIEVMGGAA